MNLRNCFFVLVATLSLTVSSFAADKGKYVEEWADSSDDWIRSDEGQRIITNIISWQNENGGWYKSYNTLQPRPAKVEVKDHPLAPKEDSGSVWAAVSTIDNQATYTELRLLARAVHLTKREDALASFNKGMAYLLQAQYPNGGWPQRYPLQKNYGRHITFNDGAMVGVMNLMEDAAAGKGDFDFVPADLQAKCKESFNRGIDCILNCQIKKDGKPTVWGQQHDEETLAPTNARAYELPSFCSTESAGLTLMLMTIENPRDQVKAAIHGAVDWFEQHKITGKKYEKLSGPQYEKGFERRLTDDPAAPPLWARFYDLENEKPMFVDRDGSKHHDVNELGYERRTGYAWYSTSPNNVLKEYSKWKARVGG